MNIISIVAIFSFFIEIHTFTLVESLVVLLVELFLHVNQWLTIDVGFDEEAEVFINFLI